MFPDERAICREIEVGLESLFRAPGACYLTPMQYAEIFAEFPSELRLPIARLVDTLKEELGVRRSDFEELKAVVRDLAEAQRRRRTSSLRLHRDSSSLRSSE